MSKLEQRINNFEQTEMLAIVASYKLRVECWPSQEAKIKAEMLRDLIMSSARYAARGLLEFAKEKSFDISRAYSVPKSEVVRGIEIDKLEEFFK